MRTIAWYLRASAICAGILLLSAEVTIANATADRSRWTLLPVETPFQPTSVLGAKKAGLLCMPNGKVHWRDVSTDDAALTDMLARHLRAEGFDVASSVMADGNNMRILKAVVTEFKVSACARRWGFGDRGALNGGGTISISWAASPSSNSASTLQFETIEKFEVDPASNPSATILQEALKVSARSAAAQLVAH